MLNLIITLCFPITLYFLGKIELKDSAVLASQVLVVAICVCATGLIFLTSLLINFKNCKKWKNYL